MARHGTGANIRVRIYFEGRLIENSFVSMTVSGSIGSPATAQLELVPTNTIKHILPGTWIHVFVTDPWDQGATGDLSDFKLLFEGVVISRGFSRQDAGRNFVVQCADPSVYWVEARQFWLNLASANGNIVDQLVTADSGGFARLGTVNSTGSYGYMNSRLGKAKDQPEERFMDTMISAIDDVGNVNPFYTNVRNRFRLTDRIVRGPAGKTSKLFELAMFSDFLEGLAGRAGGQTNLAEMVNQLLSAIMHEWVSVPAPPYLKTRIFMRDVYGNIKRNKKTVKRNVNGEIKVDLFEYETAEDNIIGGIIFKPHVYTLPPPTCNVLFPNMYDHMSYQENFLQETTRLQMQPQLPLISATLLQGVRLIRPVELEVFQALVRDPAHKTIKKRTPDAQFSDGAGQTPTFSDYDWSTNEERIRGIVYNFINLAPAPSTLTLTDPGKRTPTGARKGGVPRYLQNVASYEYYKSKYVARQTALAGPFNMRPVPGFPLLALDDSAANMNVICYLDSISHMITSSGSATTTYGISHPRLTDELDLNRPKFKSAPLGKDLDFDLLRDDEGNYDFSTVFDGANQPPIPEWFDDSYRTLEGLDLRYKEWFGASVGVVQNILFKPPSDKEKAEIAAQEAARKKALADKSTKAKKATEEDLPAALRDKIVPANDTIELHAAANELNQLYFRARDAGHEYDIASERTRRSFTTIDQAFKFVGAGPLELSDLSEPSEGEAGEQLRRTGKFTVRPAQSRVINYKTARLDRFVGDISPGSGYAGTPEKSSVKAPIVTVTGPITNPSQVDGTIVTSPIDGPVTSPHQVDGTLPPPTDRMSGAFPVFDTKIHTGSELTDAKVRKNLQTSKEERAASDSARYDGRPLMFDFEFRLWQESLLAAGYGPNANPNDRPQPEEVADYYVVEGGATRPATADEKAKKAEIRQANVAKRKKEEETRAKRGRSRAKDPNMAPADQAPTGDGLDQEQRRPLTQPLSEKQVVDLRRSVIEAYYAELASTRGFTG